MNMTRALFEHIIQQYVLPLIPVANEGRIISSDECSFANMLSEKTVQINCAPKNGLLATRKRTHIGSRNNFTVLRR